MCSQDTNEFVLCNYPIHYLNADEIANPLSVIQGFFSFAHLPEVREMLWLSFKTNVTGTFPQEEALNPKDRYYIVLLHEQLERLVEAAHLINEKRKSNENNLSQTTK